MNRKIVLLTVLFLSLIFSPLILKASEIHDIFMKAYKEKNAELMVRAMTPPQPFLSELEKYEARRGNVPLEKIHEDVKKFKNLQVELIKDCVFKYVPITNYEELKTVPDERLQRIFYVHVLEDDERFYFQDKLSCKKHLFRATHLDNKWLVFMEVCEVKNGIRPWVDRFAVFGKEGSLAMFGCIVEKMKKLKEMK